MGEEASATAKCSNTTCLDSDFVFVRALHFVFRRADSAPASISRMLVLQRLLRLTTLSNMTMIQIRFGGSLSVGVTSILFG